MFCLGGNLGCAWGWGGTWPGATGCAPVNGPGAACACNDPGESKQIAPAKMNPSNARSVIVFMFHQPQQFLGALQPHLNFAIVMRTGCGEM